MNPILQAALASVVRWLLAICAGWLVKAGIWTESDAANYVAAGALALIALGWSLWHKSAVRRRIDTALELPAGSTPEQLAARIEADKQAAAGNRPFPLILLLGALCVSVVTVPGCAWFHPEEIKPVAVAPGQDAALVNAERIHASSLGVYREIIVWETQNRAVLPAEVSRAVDKTRREFPKAWNEANLILKDYRKNRGDPTNVNRIAAALAAAQSSMLRLKVDASTSNELFTALNQLSQSIATLKAP